MIKNSRIADRLSAASASDVAGTVKTTSGARQTEVYPGFLWVRKDDGYNALHTRKDGSSLTVPLQPDFSVTKIKPVRKNKVYRVFGTRGNENKSSVFTLLYCQNGNDYALGAGVMADAKGRINDGKTTLNKHLRFAVREVGQRA